MQNKSEACDTLLNAAGEEDGDYKDRTRLSRIITTAVDSMTPAEMLVKDRLVEHNKQFIQHQHEVDNFRFPILGVSADIDYLWMVASFIGVFSLFVLYRTISRENIDYQTAKKAAGQDNDLLGLLSSSQVLVVKDSNCERSIKDVFDRVMQEIIIFAVLLMPMFNLVAVSWSRSHQFFVTNLTAPVFAYLSLAASIIASIMATLLTARAFSELHKR
jgi:hypothetical protein